MNKKPRAIDLTGQKFGKLLVLERDLEKQKELKSRVAIWKCQCDCGKFASVTRTNLIRGRAISCGCYHSEKISEVMKSSAKTNEWIIQGDITYGITNKGQSFIINTKDLDKVKMYCWYIVDGYVCKTKRVDENCNQSHTKLHRFILDAGEEEIVDHKNWNTLDNTRDNLRIADKSKNGMNAKISKRNTSGYTGVDFNKNKWRVRININKKSKTIGYYSTFEEAVEARHQAEIKYYGEYSGELNRKNYDNIIKKGEEDNEIRN